MASRRLGLVAGAAAVVLAGAGGAAAGLGAPAWLAGATAAVSAMVAGVVADRVYAAREGRVAASERRHLVLDSLHDSRPLGEDEELGLLVADRCPVPFRGRSRELARLISWREAEPGRPIMMVSGPAGVGKSRLVLEFASRLPAEWAAGWLHAGVGDQAVETVRECGDPAMILADDADGRADLVPLLEALAERHEDPAVRVVLVTRSAAGLRAALAARLDERHAWVAAGAAELNLGTEGDPSDQARWFSEAVAAFAVALDKPPPVLPERLLVADTAIEPFVMLQGQALLAVLDQDGSDPRDLPLDELAAVLMGHERRRWRAVAASWDWSRGTTPLPEIQSRVVAALALLGADTAAEAAVIVQRVSEMRDAPAERLAAMVAWVDELYPGGSGMAPRIRPDLIGEWFVVSELAADPDLARSLRAGMSDEQAARALAFLARAADRIEAATGLFQEFGSGDLRRLILAAVLAARTGEVGRGLLDPVIATQIAAASGWTLDQLIELQGTIPSHLLLRTHVAIAQLIVTERRTLSADDPASHQAGLATALNNFGFWLGKVGWYHEGLDASQEATTLFRALTADDPDAYQADLATTLINLGLGLAEVGRYHQALEATQEGITLRRALVNDNPAAHQADLATALNNLGLWLGEVGRYQEALDAAQEAITLRQALAADDPAAHQSDLANAVANFGRLLSRVGRYHDALDATQEAITLRRALAADDPAAHQADLAGALINLGSLLNTVGRHRAALEATQEATTLFRALAADYPAAHEAGLATALTNLGLWLSEVGRYQEALDATQEAITLRRALAGDNPAAHQADLANALTRLGFVLTKVGRYQEALDATQKAITLRRALAGDDADAYQTDLARAQNSLGVCLLNVGRYQEALEATQEGITLRRALAADNLAAHQAGLAIGLTNLGICLDRVGRSSDALAARIESVRLYRSLASTDPDLYLNQYQQRLTALRKEFDQRGMQYEAIMHDLADPD